MKRYSLWRTSLCSLSPPDWSRKLRFLAVKSPNSSPRPSGTKWSIACSAWAGKGREAFICLSLRSEEHTSELQSLMRISYAVFCLKKKKYNTNKLVTDIHKHN